MALQAENVSGTFEKRAPRTAKIEPSLSFDLFTALEFPNFQPVSRILNVNDCCFKLRREKMFSL